MARRTFDVFLPLSPKARLRRRLLKERYKKQIPIKGTVDKDTGSLSSYMISPEYLASENEPVKTSPKIKRSAVTATRYSQLNRPWFEQPSASKNFSFSALLAAIGEFWSRLAERARSLTRNPMSATTYSFREGVTNSGVGKFANRAIISALVVAVVFLSVLSFAQSSDYTGTPTRPQQTNNRNASSDQTTNDQTLSPPSSSSDSSAGANVQPSSSVPGATATGASSQSSAPQTIQSGQISSQTAPSGGRGGGSTSPSTSITSNTVDNTQSLVNQTIDNTQATLGGLPIDP